MIKIKINTSVPAEILEAPKSSFNEEVVNEFVTHCKLKIFYVGMTGDKREFTQEFSDELLKSLPQTPVVGFYDEEDEDFKGHNSKQYVYGYVPENTNIEYVEEDGQKWAYTDIVLFTGRKDNIGDVAKKILGRSHSLELDPDTMKYKIHEDEEGELLKIEFTEGKFVGLSVVGDAEKPAFAGSEFFKEEDLEDLKEIAGVYKRFADKIEAHFTSDSNDSEETKGGVKMNFIDKFKEELSPKIVDFYTKTYEELYMEVAEALYDQNYDAMPIQIGEDFIVYIDFNEGEILKCDYSRTDEGISFGEAKVAKERYLTEEELEALSTDPNADYEEDEEDEEQEEDMKKDDDDEKADKKEKDKDDEEEYDSHDDEDDEDEDPENMRGDDSIEKNDTATSTESENSELKELKEKFAKEQKRREELEAEMEKYRSAEKQSKLEEYKDYISEEDYESFKSQLNEYTTDELEVQLSVALAKRVRSLNNEEKEKIFTTKVVKNNKKGRELTDEERRKRFIKEHKES